MARALWLAGGIHCGWPGHTAGSPGCQREGKVDRNFSVLAVGVNKESTVLATLPCCGDDIESIPGEPIVGATTAIVEEINRCQ